MKELFAVDVSKGLSESEKFVVRTLDKTLMQKQVDFTSEIKEYEKKGNEKSAVTIARYLCYTVGLLLLTVFCVKLTDAQDFKSVFASSWAFLVFGSLLVIGGIVLSTLKKINKNKVAKDPNYQKVIKDGEALYDQCIKNLKIPQKAPDVDIFLSIYKTEGDKQKPATTAFNYVNTSVHLFSEGDSVMVADLSTVFGFKKSSFTGYEIIQKKTTFNNWNKSENISDAKYKPYGVKVTATGCFEVKQYYKINLKAFDQEYFIIIPSYDGENFVKTAGIKSKLIKSENNGKENKNV